MLTYNLCPPTHPLPPGGRTSQAIVEGAMTALRSLVKERLSGKSGGSDYSRQVRPHRAPPARGGGVFRANE